VSSASFARVVESLEPYLPQIVLVGGWAHRLFQHHPLGQPLPFDVLMTEDADLGVPARQANNLQGTAPISQLLKEAGFTRKLRDGGASYRLGTEAEGFEVEFVAPLEGSPKDREGKPKTVHFGGIQAEALRYIDILLKEPWDYFLTAEHGFPPLTLQSALRVTNPNSYLLQKVLTVHRRHRPYKQAKDALYIHDTILIFQENLDILHDQATQLLMQLPNTTQNEFHRRSKELFQDQLLRSAQKIAQESGRTSPPSSKRIKEVCLEGLDQLFALR
jgi:hypothetical protein